MDPLGSTCPLDPKTPHTVSLVVGLEEVNQKDLNLAEFLELGSSIAEMQGRRLLGFSFSTSRSLVPGPFPQGSKDSNSRVSGPKYD